MSASGNAASKGWRRPGPAVLGLVAVAGVGTLARVVAFVQGPRAPFWTAPIVDETAYLDLARALLAGTPPPHGAWYQAPGYAYFLAGILELGGGPPSARAIQLAAGVATAVLLWAVTRRLFGSAAGVVAGLLWAVAPLALLHELLLLKPALSVLMAVSAVAVLTLAERRAAVRWASAGALLGAAALLQGEMVGVAVVLLCVGAWGWRRGWPAAPTPRALAAGLLGLAAVVAIPTAQNLRWGGGFVVIAYGGGTNFYIGNHPGADGSYLPLRPDRSDALVEEADAVALATAAAGRPLTADEVSRHWFGQGLRWWRESPVAALRLSAKKLLLVWAAQEQADVLDVGMAASWLPILRNPIARPAVILPVALVGLWLSRRRREAWPLRVFLIASTLLLVPFFLFERFRMPLTAVAVPFTAHAGVVCARALRRGPRAAAVVGLAATVALGMALALPRVHRNRDVLRVNIGSMYLQAGRYDEALREFEAVRAASPGAWRVEMNIATTQALLNRREEALRTLDRLVPRLLAEAQRTGRAPVEELLHCYALAGDLHMALGRPQQALAAYEAAARYAPDHPQLLPRLRQARALAAPPPGP